MPIVSAQINPAGALGAVIPTERPTVLRADAYSNAEKAIEWP